MARTIPEISLFDLGSYSSQMLYSLLLNDYIAYMQKQGERARLRHAGVPPR